MNIEKYQRGRYMIRQRMTEKEMWKMDMNIGKKYRENEIKGNGEEINMYVMYV